MSEHIVAVFDTEKAADAAARDLENAGVSASAIRRFRPATMGAATDTSLGRTMELPSSTSGGFWAWLLGDEPSTETTRALDPRDEERYGRYAHAGKTVLGVTINDDARISDALAVLESHHPIEVDENGEEMATKHAAAQAPASARLADRGDAKLSNVADLSGREEVIPLAEENIEINKRTIDRGTTRIRRYVVETPVEREVTLHGERVTVERRTPTTTAGPLPGQFEERVVEVHEFGRGPARAEDGACGRRGGDPARTDRADGNGAGHCPARGSGSHAGSAGSHVLAVNVVHIIGTIIIGFLAGVVAKLITPGRDPGGFIVTTLLGIVGAFVATYLGQAIGWYRADEAAGFIGAVIGAVILLAIYHLIRGRTPSSRGNY